MHFFQSGLFWFIEGIFACLAIIGVKIWAEDRGIPMPFWKWMLMGIWVLLFGFTIAFVGTSLGEREPTAALIGGILFGLISLITGFIVARLILLRRRKEDT